MKHTKLIALVSVAAFALTGCKQTCSKDDFVKLANQTEEHEFAEASVAVKGKISMKNGGVKQTYEPNETFEFTYVGTGWEYTGDYAYLSSSDLKGSVIVSCMVLLSVTVRDLVKDELFVGSEDDPYGKLTCFSSPLGFDYSANFKNYKEGDNNFELVINGKSDASYIFDSKTGVVTEYTEKGDITMKAKTGEYDIETTEVTDLSMKLSYRD